MSFDLDDEELEATRKMKGLDKKKGKYDYLKEKINCISCGKQIEYGDSYKSLEIADGRICEKCHNIEFIKRNNNHIPRID